MRTTKHVWMRRFDVPGLAHAYRVYPSTAAEGGVIVASAARCGVAQPVHGITEHLGLARCRSCAKAVEKRRAA